MSTVTFSSVTFNAGDPCGGDSHDAPRHCGGQRPPWQDNCDIGYQGGGQPGGNQGWDSVLNNMNVPEAIKDLIRLTMKSSPQTEMLPSEASAVGTIQRFQKDNNIGLLSYDQMKEMATKGTLDGKPIPGSNPEAVRDAAKTYMANGGSLFDRMEQARTGERDGKLGSTDPDYYDRSKLSQKPTLASVGPGCFMDSCANNRISPTRPEEFFAVKTVEKFQQDYGIGPLSYLQMKEIAHRGTLNGRELPGSQDEREDLRDAARIYTANRGELFGKVAGCDGRLCVGDPRQSLNGVIWTPPGQSGSAKSDTQAVETIEQYQRTNGIGLISFDQMTEMATKGTLDGKRVPADVQQAAQAYVADGGRLFDKIETAVNGKNDNLLSADDAAKAREKGRIGMSADTAIGTMEAFQKLPLIGGNISREQMKEIAEKGTFKGVEVPPDVKLAARVFMDNDGAIFDVLESAKTGERDGTLGVGDYGAARDKGWLHA